MTGTVRELSVSPICLREFDVLRVWDVTPGMRRVVLGGPAIGEHVRDGVRIPAVQTTGFDDDVKIMPPDPVTGGFPFEVPRNTTTGLVEWTPGSFEYTRTYTVRSFDAEAGELAIDFALHESGLASTWARRTTPGEKILVAGPKHSAGLPTAADWMLIGGDETALPAIGHCLEKLPQTLPATVVIEVADPSHRQELSSAAPVDIIWLYRSETGGRSRLAETIQSVRWRDGQVYLWVAGETLTVKPLRRWAKRDKGIPKEFTDISGYWRERRVTTVEGDPQLVDVSAAGPDPFEAIHEYSEVLPPFALRAAVTLGVFTEIDAGATTAQDIAAACGVRAEPLLKLVRHLAAMGLLLRDGETFSLTEEGVVLADPDAPWVEELRVDSVQSQMQLSFVDLVDVIRTGRPVGIGGMPIPTWQEDQVRAGQLHGEMVEWPVYLAPALSGAISFDGVRTVAVAGEGGGPYVDAILRTFPSLDVGVVGLPSLTERMLGDVAAERRPSVRRIAGSHLAPLPDKVDLLLAAGIVENLPDDDAVVALAAYARSADRVVIPTRLLDPATTNDHETEDDLLRLCVFGSGFRTEAELRKLITVAGGEVAYVDSLGWGAKVVEYRS
ncbi:MAG: siderophore-interacting protein [Gordonia sp.]|nr:siderophore-interacting protein [Gordonia sp. (in: high G+C Gram-positive bacteria)]